MKWNVKIVHCVSHFQVVTADLKHLYLMSVCHLHLGPQWTLSSFNHCRLHWQSLGINTWDDLSSVWVVSRVLAPCLLIEILLTVCWHIVGSQKKGSNRVPVTSIQAWILLLRSALHWMTASSLFLLTQTKLQRQMTEIIQPEYLALGSNANHHYLDRPCEVYY